MKQEQSSKQWALSGMIVLATVLVIAVSGARSAAANDAAQVNAQLNQFAQSQQLRQTQPSTAPRRGGAGSFKSTGGRAEVKCNGKTTAQCCAGLSYCTCLYPPLGDSSRPLTCESIPPR